MTRCPRRPCARRPLADRSTRRLRAGAWAVALAVTAGPAPALAGQAQATAHSAQSAQSAQAPAVAGDPAAPVVRLHYQDRPPYSSRLPDGRPSGLLVAPVLRALQAAGLTVVWQLTPAQRQLALVQQGQGLDCGLGWYRTSERAALGRFSQPIHRDRPFVALLRSDRASDAPRTLEALLADPGRPLLLKTGYAYGPAIDGLLARLRPASQTTHAEPLQMARMVVAGRAGWMLVPGEEAEHLVALPEFAPAVLVVLPLAGQPAGPTRHLYCSQAVGEDWLRRFDRALASDGRPDGRPDARP